MWNLEIDRCTHAPHYITDVGGFEVQNSDAVPMAVLYHLFVFFFFWLNEKRVVFSVGSSISRHMMSIDNITCTTWTFLRLSFKLLLSSRIRTLTIKLYRVIFFSFFPMSAVHNRALGHYLENGIKFGVFQHWLCHPIDKYLWLRCYGRSWMSPLLKWKGYLTA